MKGASELSIRQMRRTALILIWTLLELQVSVCRDPASFCYVQQQNPVSSQLSSTQPSPALVWSGLLEDMMMLSLFSRVGGRIEMLQIAGSS